MCVPFNWRITVLIIVLVNAAVSVFVEVSGESSVGYWFVLRLCVLQVACLVSNPVHVGHYIHISGHALLISLFSFFLNG